MSKRTPTVALSREEVQCALRLSAIFAGYGKPDSLTSEETNFVSVLGEFAVSKYFYGSIEPVLDHRMESVRGAVMTGKIRDGHRDLPDVMLDVKSTQDRGGIGWRNLDLMVPPYQARTGTAYVGAVVETTTRPEDVREVILAGWCEVYELEPDPSHMDWHCCVHRLLRGMDSLRLEDWPVTQV